MMSRAWWPDFAEEMRRRELEILGNSVPFRAQQEGWSR
jgi:hypothetical protein